MPAEIGQSSLISGPAMELVVIPYSPDLPAIGVRIDR